jgi:hypothetical protein
MSESLCKNVNSLCAMEFAFHQGSLLVRDADLTDAAGARTADSGRKATRGCPARAPLEVPVVDYLDQPLDLNCNELDMRGSSRATGLEPPSGLHVGVRMVGVWIGSGPSPGSGTASRRASHADHDDCQRGPCSGMQGFVHSAKCRRTGKKAAPTLNKPKTN